MSKCRQSWINPKNQKIEMCENDVPMEFGTKCPSCIQRLSSIKEAMLSVLEKDYNYMVTKFYSAILKEKETGISDPDVVKINSQICYLLQQINTVKVNY